MIDLIGKNGNAKRWTPPSFFPAIREAVKSKVLAGQEHSNGSLDIFGVDPSNDIRGMPPNYGQYMLPHVTTFQGLFGTFSRVYRTSDEALNDSLENARYMRNDVGVMECLEARKRCTALLPWHLEPEDPDSHDQQQLAEAVTKIITRINRFTQYREVLLEGTFYGRYAIQHRYGWNDIGGREYVMPCKLRDDPGWKPVNGDKLVWRYDDGTGKYITDQVGIRVGQKLGIGSKINQRWVIEPTDRGLAYFLADWERSLLTIHRHTVEDGAWEDPIQAGFVHGVGIRHRIYWEWYQKQEALAFLMEYLERSAGGIEIHYYPEGNATARQRAADAVKDRVANGRNVMLYPRPVGDDSQQYGVEFVEPGVAGIESLKDLLTDYFGHRIKRYILGQTLSSEATATGLGSGVADLHYDTLQQIVRYDSINLEETLTDDLVRNIQHWNFPRSKGIYLRFKIEVEQPNIAERLEAMQKAFDMGARISNQQLMDFIGAEIPTDPSDTLQNPEAAQAAAATQGVGFGPGASGAGQAPPDTPEQVQDKVMAALYQDPEDASGGDVVHANEAGKWVKRKMPEFDTGERSREPYEADGDVYHLKRPGQPVRYKHADRPETGKERWITIGGAEGGGTHVKVRGNKIVSGPKALEGKKLGELSDDSGRKSSEKPAKAEKDGNKPFELKREPATKEHVPKQRQAKLFDPAEAAKPDVLRLPGATKDLHGLRKSKEGRWVGATQVSVDQLHVDPKRFQYKISGIDPTSGVTAELKEVKQFNPEFGGQLLGWIDPDDGKAYVVNGHHRHELASRSPHSEDWKGELNVYFVDAKTPEEARARGALANMAEGRGTAVDAAKFLRDSGRSIDDMKKVGISLKGKIAQEGSVLARLAGPIFQKVANGSVTESRGLAIASELGHDEDLQNELFQEIGRVEGKTKKDLSDAVVREMAKEYADIPVSSKSVKSLFGDSEERTSLMFERNSLKSELRKLFQEERGAFKAVAGGTGEKRQGILEREGNTIDLDKSRKALKTAEIDYDTFDKLVNYKGPISQAVNEASKELADAPKRRKSIVNGLAKRIREISREGEKVDGPGVEPSRPGSEGSPGTGGSRGAKGGIGREIAAEQREDFSRRFAQEVVRYGMKPNAARELYRRLATESVT